MPSTKISSEASAFADRSSNSQQNIPSSTAPQNSNNKSINYLRDIISLTAEREITITHAASSAHSIDQSQSVQVTQRRSSSTSIVTNNHNQSEGSLDPERCSSSISHVSNQTENNAFNRRGRSSARSIRSLSPNSNSQVSNSSRTERTNSNNQQQQQRSKRRRIATQRLDQTIEATDKLVALIEEKTEMKERYYQYKLELIEANVKAKERIASALTSIATTMNQNPT